MYTPNAILGDLGLAELFLVAIASVLIFGRDLPRVAARAFAQFQRLRRTLTEMWRETGIEDELRRVQREIDRSLPRDIDPARMARRETHEIERKIRAAGRSLAPGGARDPAPESPRDAEAEIVAAPPSEGADAAQRAEAEAPAAGAPRPAPDRAGEP